MSLDHRRKGRVYPNNARPSVILTRLAGALVCVPLLYTLVLQLFPRTRHTTFVDPHALLMFLFFVLVPSILLYVCIKIAGKRTARVCLTVLVFFVVVDCWLFKVGGGAVAPAIGLIELMIGGVLLPIAVATGDRRTGL